MDHIGSLLPKVLAKRGLKKQAQASLMVHKATQWIEKKLPDFSDDVNVLTFRDGILKISCANSIASQECHQISDRLKEHLRGIEEIHIVRG